MGLVGTMTTFYRVVEYFFEDFVSLMTFGNFDQYENFEYINKLLFIYHTKRLFIYLFIFG